MKILHVVSSLNTGGVEALLRTYQSKIDDPNIIFDYVVHGCEEGILENSIKQMNSIIYKVTPKKTNIFRNIKEMINIYKNNYDIVHIHQGPNGVINIVLARIFSKSKVIVHNHIAYTPKSIINSIAMYFKKVIVLLFTKNLVSCSYEAGIWAYGKKNVLNERVFILPNAIDLSLFKYDATSRNEIRNINNVDDMIVIGCVARFSDQKNHAFLVDVLNELVKKSNKYCIWFFGDGPLETTIKKRIVDLGLSAFTKFFGSVSNISKQLNAIDLFVLPTKYEGLGIVYIESQALGLPTFASLNKVPIETNITPLIKYLDIEKGTSLWVDEILNTKLVLNRNEYREMVENSSFNVDIAYSSLINYYKKILGESL